MLIYNLLHKVVNFLSFLTYLEGDICIAMNRKKVLFGLVLSVALVLAIVFWGRYSNTKSIYSCYQIPIVDGKLSWGMDTAKVISVIGEPSSVKHEEYVDILTYDTCLPCELGICTQAVFYIGIEDKIYADERFSSGLGVIEITVEDSSQKSILNSLSDIYGDLSPDGGETQMEAQFKNTNPDYFNQYHFCEEWKASTLPQDSFNRLSQVQETVTDRVGIPVDKSTPLMYVNFWGTDGNPCTIQLNASVLAVYLNTKK